MEKSVKSTNVYSSTIYIWNARIALKGMRTCNIRNQTAEKCEVYAEEEESKNKRNRNITLVLGNWFSTDVL